MEFVLLFFVLGIPALLAILGAGAALFMVISCFTGEKNIRSHRTMGEVTEAIEWYADTEESMNTRTYTKYH